MQARGFVLGIGPFIVEVGWLRLSWYGLTSSPGFFGIWPWLRWRRADIGWSRRDVVGFAMLYALCVLVGGRLVDLVFSGWHHDRDHLVEIAAFRHGGLATHGPLAGAVLAVHLFARRQDVGFFAVADRIVVPAALVMDIGRVGDFLEGGVIGYPTDVPWSVRLPDTLGCRHPVAIHDGLKTLAIVPVLLLILRRRPAGSGIATACGC